MSHYGVTLMGRDTHQGRLKAKTGKDWEVVLPAGYRLKLD